MTLANDDALSGAILETVPLPVLALDADLRVETANDAFLRQFRVSREETVGRLVYDLGNGQWNIPELRRLLGEILPRKSTVTGYRVAHDFERIGRRIMHVDARRIARTGDPDLILLAISDDTERESLRAELIGRIEMADKLIDSVREGLLVLEPDLRVCSASGSFYETFDVDPADTVGHLVYELGNGQWDIPDLRKLLEDVLPRERSFDDYEVTHYFERIGKRVMLLNGRRLDHQDLILLAIRDITDSRESAMRLKEVAQTAHVGVLEADLRTGEKYWSPEMRDIVGLSRDAPAAPMGAVPDFVHPDDRRSVARMYRDMLDPEGDGSVAHEHRIVRPDGEVRWVRMHGQTEFALDEGKRRPVRLRGVLLDVTESKQAEADRRRAHALLKGIAGGAQDLIAAVDPDFRLLYANDAYLREYRALWGHDLKLGENLLEHMEPWPEEQKKAREIWSRALSGETFNIVMEFGPSETEERVYDLRFTPLRDEQGNRIGATHILQDVTARKRAEAALRERERHQRFLLGFSDALRAEPDAEAMAERAIRLLTQQMRLDRCYIVSYDLEAGMADIPHQTGNDSVPPLPDRVPFADFPEVVRLTSEGTLVIHDVDETEGLSDQDRSNLHALGLGAVLAAAVRRKDTLLSAIAAISSQPRVWTPGEIALVEEVGERTWTAMERARTEAALRESEARFRRIADANLIGIGFATAKGELLDVNDEMLRMMGRTRAEFEAGEVYWTASIAEEDRPALAESLDTLRREGAVAGFEGSFLRPGGEKTPFLGAAALTEPDGDIHVLLALDLTERKHAEEHQTMLMAELDHRVKNILALVQSIARQSLGRGKTVGPEAADLLIGRLNALAQSHALLAGSRWEGARFRDIVESALAPHRAETGERITAEGPDLKVTPKAAQSLNLALHELVTNAAKYGALSREAGRVSVEWHVEGEGRAGRLILTWQEQGGPEIRETPSRKGFGSRLIEQALTAEFGAKVTIDFARDGLRVVVDLPLDQLSVREGQRNAAPQVGAEVPAGDPALLRGKKVLVVEDEYFIGQETAEGLKAAGCRVTGPVSTVTDAVKAAASEDLDMAVLDINLNGEFAWPAAHVLRARGIPLVLTTGYSDTVTPPPELQDALRVEKPMRRERLFSTLAALVAGNARG